MLLYLLSRIVSTVAGSVYPAYASYKAINSRSNTRLTAWLMYWTVMGLFTLVEFVLDTFIFWFPFYYEIKLIFVLWMIMPQTQGSIYLYQKFVDPYLSQHEHDIDKALKDMQNQAMAMGMQYIKQAVQMIQNLAFDMYKKSAGTSSLTDKDNSASVRSSQGTTDTYAPHHGAPTPGEPTQTEAASSAAQGYLSWAYHALSPKFAAVATMASETASRHVPSRPLPVPPVNLYGNRTPSAGSTSSRDSSVSGYSENILGINNSMTAASSSMSASDKAELERLSSRLNRAAELTGASSDAERYSSLRNRKISLYEDDIGDE
ncbi:receptor accessory protein 4 [Dissophora globulifera]|uniref:Protein YOP1 n=1 Tax=Dissophora globulifera TaxID=979702 RepID=A0A9P6V063_9FUNG|nr:receptor accessory protein 4 [Dissophora globulifera]